MSEYALCLAPWKLPKKALQPACQVTGIIGLFLQGIGVAEAFAGKVDGIDLMASQPQIPVVAIEWRIN